MLAVAARLAPDGGGGGVGRGLVAFGAAFAIAFHHQLLQIRGQALQAGMVGRQAAAVVVQEAGFPYFEQTQQQGQVFMGRGLCEVLVYGACACQQLHKALCAYGYGKRQANG